MNGNMSGAGLHRFSHDAMATVFEAIIAGEDAAYAAQAAAAAFDEIDRLERLLSRFDPGSDLARINRLQPGASLLVTAETHEILTLARHVHVETGGAFDPAVGRLMDARRNEAGVTVTPDASAVAEALRAPGLAALHLSAPAADASGQPEPGRYAVGLDAGASGPVGLDLGGIGKGYALDRAAEILERWGIGNGLLHGGTSTVLGLGAGPRGEGWPVRAGGAWSAAAGLERVALRNAALSGSGMEVKGAHVVDPRTGHTADGHVAAWVLCPSATLADALSTAFMVMPAEDIGALCRRNPQLAALLVADGGGGEAVLTRLGDWPAQPAEH